MFRFLGFKFFFVFKNSNSFINYILKIQKLELNNLNQPIEFNQSFNDVDVVPSIDLSLRYGV